MKPINRNEPFVTENSEIFRAKDLSGRTLDFCIGVIAHGHDVVPIRPGGGLLFRQSSVYSPTEFWAQAGPAIVVDWTHTVSKLHEWFGDQWAECIASDLRLWLLRARVAVMFGDVFTAELAGICEGESGNGESSAWPPPSV
jgi:hypothetical protein